MVRSMQKTPLPVIDAHAHCGIKWHRHADEPVYRYDDPRVPVSPERDPR